MDPPPVLKVEFVDMSVIWLVKKKGRPIRKFKGEKARSEWWPEYIFSTRPVVTADGRVLNIT